MVAKGNSQVMGNGSDEGTAQRIDLLQQASARTASSRSRARSQSESQMVGKGSQQLLFGLRQDRAPYTAKRPMAWPVATRATVWK